MHERFGLHGQIRPLHRRTKIRNRRRRAATVADAELRPAEAHRMAAVIVVGLWKSQCSTGRGPGLEERVRRARELDADRTRAAAILVRPAFPGLAPFEVRQNLCERPTRRAVARPTIEIG